MIPEQLERLEWRSEWPADGSIPCIAAGGGKFPPHQHLFFELVLVTSGRGRHQDASGETFLSNGDILLVHPHAWHVYPDESNLKLYNCLFQPRLLTAHPGMVAELGEARRLIERRHENPAAAAPLRLHASGSERKQLRDLFECMRREQQQCRAGWRAALLSAFFQSLVIVKRLDPGSVMPDNELPSDAAIDGIAHQLATHYKEPLSTVSELARDVDLSPSYLSRRFVQRYGLGIVAYVHQLRIEEACRRLVFDNDSITSIALAIGYDDPAYFSRIFSRLVGYAPRRYRQRRS